MAKNYEALAKDIVRLVGGESNVTHFEHCSTRLRFSVADAAKVEKDKLKATAGVMGVVGSGPPHDPAGSGKARPDAEDGGRRSGADPQ